MYIYIDFYIENNKEDLKLEAGDQVRIWKYKSIFTKGYITNWSDEFFVVKKI